jgi:hypothetical protein
MKRHWLRVAVVLVGSVAIAACSAADPNHSFDGTGNGNGNGDPASGSDSGSGNGDGSDSGAPAPARDAGGNTGHDAGTSGGNDAGTTAHDAGVPPAQDAGQPPPNDGFDAFQHHNLDVVNAYRATLNVAPLVLDKQLCTFAQAGSVELSQDHTPHQHFITAGNNGSLWTSGFNGGAAENQGDPNGWFVMSQDATQNEMMQIDDIQKAMFNEGPGAGEAHGHYTNMMNAAYKRLGVGLLEVGGKLYLTNDFSQ